jgi:hypothetical protein
MVWRPSIKFFWARAIIFTTSSFLDNTQERWKNSASRELAITRARLVLPHHGGHQRRIEGIRPASINLRIDFPIPIRCCCQTRSSIFSGRRREARGVMSREKRVFIEWIIFLSFWRQKERNIILVSSRMESVWGFYFKKILT